MIRIIYISSAVAPLSDSELDALLEASRRNNQKRGVTGLLLYRDGDFMQILEGEEAPVREIYARILADPRHSRVIQLDDSPIASRGFGEWSMGFQRIRASDAPAGFVDFFSGVGEAGALPGRGSEAFQFLLGFREIGR